jgi:hypothetical protein
VDDVTRWVWDLGGGEGLVVLSVSWATMMFICCWRLVDAQTQ